MCGIVGVVTKGQTTFSTTQENVFEDMLYVDAVRGEDSTGVILVDKDETFHIAKEASPPAWFIPQLMQFEPYKKMWTKGKAAIGHNRKKTIGKIEDVTAHPFVVNNEFAMVHNGTLTGHRQLANTNVDSEALAIVLHKAFEKADFKEDLEETLGKVNGAYAVAMYDQRHNKIRLLRNKERPLAMIETPTNFFFASEASMLFWILQRQNVPLFENKLKIVPEHTVVEIDIATGATTFTEITPKKILPPPTKSTYTPMENTFASKGGFTYKKKTEAAPAMSKNMYKKTRRRLLNKKIEWWSEDYIEQAFPRTELDGETSFWVMGTCDDMTEDHLIKTVVDIKDLNIGAGRNLADRLWTGLIIDVQYDKATKKLLVYLEDSAPAPVSYRKPITETIDADYIRRKLDEQEKALVTLH